jgi:hypothetical protein
MQGLGHQESENSYRGKFETGKVRMTEPAIVSVGADSRQLGVSSGVYWANEFSVPIAARRLSVSGNNVTKLND